MSGRVIWVVRLIGIVVFLVLMYLLASLHARLVKMNEEGAGRQSGATGINCELRIADWTSRNESHAETQRRREGARTVSASLLSA